MEERRSCDKNVCSCPKLSEIGVAEKAGVKFNFQTFLVGIAKLITSPAFIAFGMFSFFYWYYLSNGLQQFNGHSHYLIIGYIIVTVVFVLKVTIEKVLEIVAHKTTVDVKLGAQMGGTPSGLIK